MTQTTESTESTPQRRRSIGPWKWLVLLIGLLVVVIAIGLVTSDNDRNSKSTAASSALCSDKLLKMERNGTAAGMLEQHQTMMEQMRAGLSPQMQQLMDADPMWKLMLSGDFTQMMQDQQQDIDRMLAANSTCGSP